MSIISKKDENQRDHINGKVLIKTDSIPHRISKMIMNLQKGDYRMSINVSREMAKTACDALAEKKAEELRVIDISEISPIADYFIIATGTNTNQLQSMVDAVDEKLTDAGHRTKQIEGNRSSSWILMDYGDIIVHLFSKEDRLFYNLERIWTDGKKIEVDEL